MQQQSTILTIPGPRTLQYDPVPSDDDELIRSIENDPVGVQGDEPYWDLHEEIDPVKLDAFWDKALSDLGGMAPEQSDDLAADPLAS